MNKLLKIFGQIIGVLLILYIIIMILLLLLVKTKNFTPIITKLFYEKTGQVMHIDGEISLSVFPWPTIGASRITIENPKQFKAPSSIKYLAKIRKVSARLKLIDLFYGNVHPTNILLEGMDLNLVTKRSGKTNWGQFMTIKQAPHTDKTDPIRKPPRILNASQFPVIQISKTNIHIINLKTNSRTAITHFSLNSPGSRDPLKREVTFSANIKHDDPKTVLSLHLNTEVDFDPKQSSITLRQIVFSAKWLQIQHILPKPVVLMMRGKANIRNKDFKTSLHGNFGEHEGNINIIASRTSGQINTTVTLKEVDVNPLFEILTGRDWITGTINASTNLTARGKTFNRWINTLSGKGAFRITQGKIKGLDMNFLLINTLNQLLSQSQQKRAINPSAATTFETISASFSINQGQLNCNDFLLNSKTIAATGKGQINLPNARINATLLATYAKNPNWKIPLKIRGSLFNPKIQPDAGAIAENLLKKNVQKGLGKTLEDVSKQLKGLFD